MALRKDERERVADVFTTHQRFVESVARQHTSHPQDVPDIVQNVALQVCRGLNGYRGEAEIRTWLYRVTVNEARIHHRKQSRHLAAVGRMAASPDPEPILDPDQAVHANQRLEALDRAVKRLTEAQRNALRNSGIQISRHTRWRAMNRLRAILTEDEGLGD